MSSDHTPGGYICKTCAGPSPIGVGYHVATTEAATASAGITTCACGHSQTPGTAQVPAEWVTERVDFLRELATKTSDAGIAAGLESAALVLETELSTYRNGGAA